MINELRCENVNHQQSGHVSHIFCYCVYTDEVTLKYILPTF